MSSSDSGHDSGTSSFDGMADPSIVSGDSLHVSEPNLPPSPVLLRESPVLQSFLSDIQTISQLDLFTRLETPSENEIFSRDEGMPSFLNNTPHSELVLNQTLDSVNNSNEITRENGNFLLRRSTIHDEHNNENSVSDIQEHRLEIPEEQSRVSQQQRDTIITNSIVATQTDSSVPSQIFFLLPTNFQFLSNQEIVNEISHMSVRCTETADNRIEIQFISRKLEERRTSFSPIKPAPPILSKLPICSERSSNTHIYQCTTSKPKSKIGGSNLTSPSTVSANKLSSSSEVISHRDTELKKLKDSNVNHQAPQSLWLIAPPNALQVHNFGHDSFDYLKFPVPIDHNLLILIRTIPNLEIKNKASIFPAD